MLEEKNEEQGTVSISEGVNIRLQEVLQASKFSKRVINKMKFSNT